MHVQDTINFLSKITLKKAWNAGKIFSSYQLTKMRAKPVVSGLPFTLSVEPTTACNLRCPECPSGLRSFSRPVGNTNFEHFKKLVDQNASHLIYLILYFQGEPYIHPDFLKMASYASAKNIYTITSTNGHFLDDQRAKDTVLSGLDRLIISVDGVTQDVYENYRKEGKLEQVIQGTKNLIRWKKKLQSRTPHVIFQFLVVSHNEHQIPAIYDLANDLGVNEVKLKSAQIYNYQAGHDLIPKNLKYSRYKRMDDGSYQLKYKIENRCWKLWHAAVVTWDGKIVPCCFDKDASHAMGDLRDSSLKEIWHNTNYRQFRNKLSTSRKEIDICSNCSEGCSVWVE